MSTRTRSLLCIFLLILVVTVGGTSTTAMADVVPVDVSAFTPGATIETFEDIAGVELPTDPFWTIFADVPTPFDFGNGVSLTGAQLASILDFSADPGSGGGWGLSLDGGTIDETTVIPSGTAFLTHANAGPGGEIVPLEFTFAEPVARVGAFVEASLLTGILDGYVSLEAFDAGGSSLGLVDGYADGAGIHIDTGEDLGPLDTWLGLEIADGQALIHSVEIVGDYMVMDDLHFQVPEPTALSLLALAGLLGLRRRS